jgi:hypothetical protein
MSPSDSTRPDSAVSEVLQYEVLQDEELRHIRDLLRGLRFGYVNIIVQDGVIVQIERTEKHRIQHSGRKAR